jgi:probable HAF family extracellular repeat protein
MTAIPASKIRVFVLATVLSLCLGFLSPASAATIGVRAYLIDLNTREVTALEALNESRGQVVATPSAINEAGQVAGASWARPFTFHAFVTGTKGTGITDLGAGFAFGINDAGQVVGVSETHDQAHNAVIGEHAFVTGPNGMGLTDLGTFGARASRATGINNSSQVIGNLFTDAEGQHAFITGPNGVGMTDLGTFGGISSSAAGINDAGQVVGSFVTAEGPFHTFVTGPDGMGMTDLGALNGISSSATAINNIGQIAGSFLTAEQQSHAFFAGPNGEGFTDLGTLGGISSAAFGINDAGQVVGTFVTTSYEEHAFVTGPDGVGTTDLNLLIPHTQSVFLWTQALGINNHGQVIVQASIVPEPETYVLLLAGLALLGLMTRRKFWSGMSEAAV